MRQLLVGPDDLPLLVEEPTVGIRLRHRSGGPQRPTAVIGVHGLGRLPTRDTPLDQASIKLRLPLLLMYQPAEGIGGTPLYSAAWIIRNGGIREYAIATELIIHRFALLGILDENGILVVDWASSPTMPGTCCRCGPVRPASIDIRPGKRCPECGNHAAIRKDGCDFCSACGAVGGGG